MQSDLETLASQCLSIQRVFDLFVKNRGKINRVPMVFSLLVVARQRPLDWKRFSQTAHVIDWKLLIPYFLLPISDVFHKKVHRFAVDCSYLTGLFSFWIISIISVTCHVYHSLYSIQPKIFTSRKS